MERDVFFVVFEAQQQPELKLNPIALAPFGVSTDSMSLLDHTNIVLRSIFAMKAGLRNPSAAQISTVGHVDTLSEANTAFYSWNRKRLSPSLPACSIPKPGVVICLKRPKDASPDWSSEAKDMDMIAASARSICDLMRDQPNMKQLFEFLTGPAAHADPVTPMKHEVFFSHAVQDVALARELRDMLSEHGVSVFMAELDVVPGATWSDEIRENLSRAKAALILLTPRSKDRPWVMAEAGALWALRIPFVPAFTYLNVNELPEFIKSQQAVEITTMDGRFACVKAIKALVKSAIT